MNPWEDRALESQDVANAVHDGTDNAAQNPIFHDELYTASGVDAVGILLEMYNRPNPQVDIGPVDTSCPFIICDLTQPDAPIIYASEAFELLTGYARAWAVGRNCRFLQRRRDGRTPRRTAADREALRTVRHAVRDNRDCQVTVTNYRHDGAAFSNLLTIIPVRYRSDQFNYSIGLQSVAGSGPA